jgi:hypothetical protein
MADRSRKIRPPIVRTLVVAVGGLTLIAAHAIGLYYASVSAIVPAVAAAGVALIVIKHVGLLGPLYAWFRRRARNAREDP